MYVGHCEAWKNCKDHYPVDLEPLPKGNEDFESKLFVMRRGNTKGLGLWLGNYFPEQIHGSLKEIDDVLETVDQINGYKISNGLERLALRNVPSLEGVCAYDFEDADPLTSLAVGFYEVEPEDLEEKMIMLRSCYVYLETIVNNRYSVPEPFADGETCVRVPLRVELP